MARLNSEDCGFTDKLIECARVGSDGAMPASPTTCQKLGCGATILVRESTLQDPKVKFTATIEGGRKNCAEARDTLNTLINGPQELVRLLFGTDEPESAPGATAPSQIGQPPRPDDPPQLEA